MIHPLYSVYDYNKNTENTEEQTIFRVYARVCLHLIFVYFFATMQYDDLFMIDPVHFIQWAHEDCTTYRGISSYFVMIAKTDSNFLNNIYIVRAIHSFCPEESDKQMVSLFLCFN